MQVRIKDEPETETSFKPELLMDLKRLFSLRHQLVHHPGGQFIFSQEILERIYSSAFLVLGSNIVLMEMIAHNEDPEVAEQRTRSRSEGRASHDSHLGN
jgi:hypothetical protein